MYTGEYCACLTHFIVATWETWKVRNARLQLQGDSGGGVDSENSNKRYFVFGAVEALIQRIQTEATLCLEHG
jgi:hypothetical protein